jgi:hypothetical protein
MVAFPIRRTINVRHNGSHVRGELTVGDIRQLEDGRWACGFFVPAIAEYPSKIYGDDPLQALTRCLWFLNDLIRKHEADGWEVWWQHEGDHAGLT